MKILGNQHASSNDWLANEDWLRNKLHFEQYNYQELKFCVILNEALGDCFGSSTNRILYYSCPGVFVPRIRMVQAGLFLPRLIHILDYSYNGPFVSRTTHTLIFVPWTIRTIPTRQRSYPWLFASMSFCENSCTPPIQKTLSTFSQIKHCLTLSISAIIFITHLCMCRIMKIRNILILD